MRGALPLRVIVTKRQVLLLHGFAPGLGLHLHLNIGGVFLAGRLLARSHVGPTAVGIG